MRGRKRLRLAGTKKLGSKHYQRTSGVPDEVGSPGRAEGTSQDRNHGGLGVRKSMGTRQMRLVRLMRKHIIDHLVIPKWGGAPLWYLGRGPGVVPEESGRGVKRPHPTTLVLDPAQQPLSKEVHCPAHDGPNQFGHLGAQGLQGVGWALELELISTTWGEWPQTSFLNSASPPAPCSFFSTPNELHTF